MIRFTTLGAGQYYLTPGDVSLYNSAGHLIETPRAKILFDLGRGCLYTLTKLGISVHDIDVICLSHLHPDHVADLLPFFQAHFVEYAKLPERRNKRLTLLGPTGLQAWLETQFTYLVDELPYQPQIIEMPKVWQAADLVITSALLQHAIPNLGWRLSCAGKTIVYSGDTGFTPALVELAHHSDVLVLECANDSGQVTPHHLSPEECGQIAHTAQAKHLVLTHYGSRKRQAGLRRATQQYFRGTLDFGETEQSLCMS